MPSRVQTLAAAAGIILTFLIAFEPLQQRASENVINTTASGANNTTQVAVNNTTVFAATSELTPTVVELAPLALLVLAAGAVLAAIGGMR
jgi:hypothetical protein